MHFVSQRAAEEVCSVAGWEVPNTSCIPILHGRAVWQIAPPMISIDFILLHRNPG
jgi:hypothetical protein